jgi:WD40 repeat protein
MSLDDPKSETPALPTIDITKSRLAIALKHTSPFISCRFDPQGRYVFAGAQDNSVQRFTLADSKATPIVGVHDSWVRGLAFHAASDTLITGGYDGRLAWWPAAAEKPEPIRTIDAHAGWIKALDISPDGAILASSSNDQTIKLWNAADGSPLGELKGHANHVYNIAWHPAAGQSASSEAAAPGTASEAASQSTPAPRGHLASIDQKGVIKHWDLAEGKEVRQLTAADLWKYDTTFGADIGGARGMEFSSDGKWLVCGGITNVSNAFAGIGNPAVVLFDWEKGEKKLLLRPKENFNASTWGLNFHPSGILVTVSGGGSGGNLIFYNLDKPEPLFTFKLPNTGRDMHLAPDGVRVAVAHHDNHVRVYELRAKA